MADHMTIQQKMPLNEFTAPFMPPLEVKASAEEAFYQDQCNHYCQVTSPNSDPTATFHSVDCLGCDANRGLPANEGSYTATEETDLDQFLLDCTSSRVDSGNSLSNDQESQENNSSNRNSFSFGVNSSQGGNAGDSSGCASPVAEKFGSATGFEETSSVQEINATSSEECHIEMEESSVTQTQFNDCTSQSILMLEEDEGSRLPLISREGLRMQHTRSSIFAKDRLRKSSLQVDYLKDLFNKTGGKLDRKQRKRAMKVTGLSWIQIYKWLFDR